MAFMPEKSSSNNVESQVMAGYANNLDVNLDVPLTGPVDPGLNFSQPPIIRSSRPEGISTLREWGDMKFPEGKWKNATFADVFRQDQKYVHFMANHTKLVSPWALSFKSYVSARLKAQIEHEELKKKMVVEMEKKVREVLMTGSWGTSLPSNVDWEVISQTVQSGGASPPIHRTKRSMEDEIDGNQMKPEYAPENKIDKITRMALLQRELDRLREEVDQ